MKLFQVFEGTNTKGPCIVVADNFDLAPTIQRRLDRGSVVGTYSSVIEVNNPTNEKIPYLFPVWEFESNQECYEMRRILFENGFEQVKFKP